MEECFTGESRGSVGFSVEAAFTEYGRFIADEDVTFGWNAGRQMAFLNDHPFNFLPKSFYSF